MSRLKREPESEIRPSSLTARATPRAGSSDQPPCSRTALSPREPGAILRGLHAGGCGRPVFLRTGRPFLFGMLPMTAKTISFALMAALAAAPGILAQIPRSAPELTATDQVGRTIRLSSYRGKVVALELMLTTCSHCQNTSRILSRLQKEVGPRGFQALGLAFNDETGAHSAQFAKEFNPTYPIAPISQDKA